MQGLDQRGALSVLRHGFKFHGQTIRLAYFAPGHGLNPEVWKLYEQNRLRVVRQLRYDPKNDNELDLVLFLNGLPVATAELKNPITGQRAGHARQQYKEHRDPNAPIFRFKTRALVHFAVDTDEVWMTTRLRGSRHASCPSTGATTTAPATRRSRASTAPATCGRRSGSATACSTSWGASSTCRRSEEQDPNTGRVSTTETMIFPRYHQLDCVRRLVAARAGAGGRAPTTWCSTRRARASPTPSPGWPTAWPPCTTRRTSKVYDAVVVLTDRKVLDQQLQDTIYQFEHKTGRGGEDRHQLRPARQGPGRRRAHHHLHHPQVRLHPGQDRATCRTAATPSSSTRPTRSQTGEMAVTVKELLSDSSIAAEAGRSEGEDLSAPDQLALRAALFRGPQPNMSFFAFTATPKYKTLELFGHQGPDGKPAPFHLYSMRQAIEEGFILDVLQGYTTYKRFFQLAKAVADDPELDKRKAAAALARFVNLHPTNIAQKTEIIIEHFRSCVTHKLQAARQGHGGDRLPAAGGRYKQAFDAYLKDEGLHGHPLPGGLLRRGARTTTVPGVTYTEPGMNRRASRRPSCRRSSPPTTTRC